MTEHSRVGRIEPRWPAAATLVAVLWLLVVLPGRIRLLPAWFPYVLGIAVLVPITGVGLTHGSARWLRIERAILAFFFVAASISAFATLSNLIAEMIQRSTDLTGIQLLASSIAIWVTNLLAFTLLYWQMDRGGPEARLNDAGTKPDWLFPQDGLPASIAEGWRPTFVDYLFLGFSTATAFSPADAVPLTSRAKVLMMLESSISLVTVVTVAARAINILGS
jgi:hypothetical protein